VFVPALGRVAEVRRALTGAQGAELATWDPASDGPPTVVRLEGVTNFPAAFAVSADGRVVTVCTSPSTGQKGRVSFHTPADGRRTAQLPADDSPGFNHYTQLALSADGRIVAGIGTGNFETRFSSIDLFRAADGQRVYRDSVSELPRVRFASCPIFTPDGNTLLYVKRESTVGRVDTQSGTAATGPE
ncbi:MAG TPA: hypothetical protein VH092_03740, partial [Urbifossiella sp.]|nr:hypothetical protein [Urbifossiella sp.]